MGDFAPDGYAHSFFCIFDGVTGEKLTCPNSSSGHAFCSAIVDNTPGRNETAWVFCSAWDRANSTSCEHPGWGCGACANPAGGCYVGTWSCSGNTLTDADCGPWSFTQALTLPGTVTVPNVGVGLVPRASSPPNLPVHQAFMALETSYGIAVNVGNDDGNLAQNWILLDPQVYGVSGVGNSGLCPFARFNPADSYYYVAGGGRHINLGRSKNLTFGSWEAPPAGAAIEVGCTELAEDCSPTSPVARIADGFYTNYWANGSDRNARDFLQNLTAWDWSVNDADVEDNGTHTFFLYGQCAQTAPKNFTGRPGYFYQVGIFEGTTLEWLASYFN